jgi:hypothetical protein
MRVNAVPEVLRGGGLGIYVAGPGTAHKMPTLSRNWAVGDYSADLYPQVVFA